MKYFFLLDGWQIGRVWEFGGLWDESVWRRRPEIQRTNLQIIEQGDRLWLYWVEDAVLMVEVLPDPTAVSPAHNQSANQNIGQVVLKRLITAEQAIERLNQSQEVHLQGTT